MNYIYILQLQGVKVEVALLCVVWRWLEGGVYLAGQYFLLPCVWYLEIHRHIQVDDYNHVEYIYALVGFPRNFKEIFHSFVHGEFVLGVAAVLCTPPELYQISGGLGPPVTILWAVGAPWDRTESHRLGRQMTKVREIVVWLTGEI